MADYKDGTNFVVVVKSKNGHGDNKNLTYNSNYKIMKIDFSFKL